MENIFTNTSDRGLISKIYRELTKLNTKKTPVKKWAKDLHGTPLEPTTLVGLT